MKICVFILTVAVTSRWVQAVPLGDFYPFGLENGDAALPPLTDGSSGPIPLRVPFPFFDRLETQLNVDVHGTLLFEAGDQAHHTPDCSPVESASRMIAAFWADIVTHDGVDGAVFFRQENRPTLLRKAARDIVDKFPQMAGLRLRWLFVATWFNVTFYGAEGCQLQSSRYPRNTFQVVLATDGLVSFALLNYNQITWTTSRFRTSAGNCSGLGGFPARVGFDPGDMKNFYSLKESCTDDIVHVDELSNTNQPGKWLFRIDNSAQIQMSDGCKGNETKFDGKLRVTPSFVDVFGGPVTLQGPCFDSKTSKVFCSFHDPVKGRIRSQGHSKVFHSNGVPVVHCLAPLLHETGRIKVELEIISDDDDEPSDKNKSSGSTYFGQISVIKKMPEVVVTFLPAKGDAVVVEWEPESRAIANATEVDVEVLLFDGNSSTWKHGGILARKIPNSGSHDFESSTFIPNDGLAILAVVRSDGSEKTLLARKRRQVSTESIDMDMPVGDAEILDMTFNEPYKESEISDFLRKIDTKSKQEKAEACNRWYLHDEGVPIDQLPPCPPRLTMVRMDMSFEQDRCAYFLTKDSCLAKFHPGAFDSYLSANPTEDGYGQQCTYDKAGNLLVGPMSGGHADLASPWSFFGETNHMDKDVTPWIACCSESDLELCRKYYEKRPSDDGSRYRPPAIGSAVGDPHISTFDQLHYTFNGVGEFWMVKPGDNNETSSGFQMQARMEKFPAVNATASVFTGFAMRDGMGPTVQVQLSQFDQLVDVLINSEPIPFDNQLLMVQQFDGVTVRARDANLSDVSVTFSSGVAFRFRSNREAMSIISSASWKKRASGKFRGLLGDFDGNPSNDLTVPDGSKIEPNSSLSSIHYDFGMKWAVAENETIFFGGGNISEPDFEPVLEIPQKFVDELPIEVRMVCNGSQTCLFDFLATGGDLNVAGQTAEVSKIVSQVEIVVEEQKEVTLCPSFVTSPNVIVTSPATVNGFTEGAVVKFGCDNHRGQKFNLNGTSEIICRNGSWSARPPVCLAVVTSIPAQVTRQKNCRTVESPLNGWIVVKPKTKTWHVKGTTLEFACEHGFVLEGAASIVCTKKGTWTDEPPRCRQVQQVAVDESATSSGDKTTTLQSPASTSSIVDWYLPIALSVVSVAVGLAVVLAWIVIFQRRRRMAASTDSSSVAGRQSLLYRQIEAEINAIASSNYEKTTQRSSQPILL